jgi:hypothetical protein
MLSDLIASGGARGGEQEQEQVTECPLADRTSVGGTRPCVGRPLAGEL